MSYFAATVNVHRGDPLDDPKWDGIPADELDDAEADETEEF